MPITVFIADDHAIVRDGLRLLLEAGGGVAVVGEAGDGREAVRGVKDLQPDVAIVDLAMPSLDGFAVTEKIRQISPATHVLILSMYATAEHIHHAFLAGAAGYVLKEAASKEVKDAVMALAAGGRYLSRKIDPAGIRDLGRGHGVKEDDGPLARLSLREREVLRWVVEGKSSSEIAAQISLSPKTVDTYRSRLMEKLGVDNLPALVKFAVQHELTSAG